MCYNFWAMELGPIGRMGDGFEGMGVRKRKQKKRERGKKKESGVVD